MLRLRFHAAAGATTSMWYETGGWTPVSNNARVVTESSEILEGPLAGATILQRWFGRFDPTTGETYEVDSLRIIVGGQLHQSVIFDNGFTNTGPEWHAAFDAGISFSGNNFANVLTASNGGDMLFGLGGNDTLESYHGDDWLDGGAGRDLMRGGLDDDTYVVNHAGDRVSEAAYDGHDTVRASVNFRLGYGAEDLILIGPALRGEGNALDNRITGNAAGNALHGADGNDVLLGAAGVDRLYGGAGDDALLGGVGNDLLHGAASVDRLYGGLGDDALLGGVGNDLLHGGLGADRMAGGWGDDTYLCDGQDSIVERGGQGIDIVKSAVGFRLPAFVENLTLIGGAGIGGLGNPGSNLITGNAAGNALGGGGGNDRLVGGPGPDVLTGGAGNDQFVFRTAAETQAGPGHDLIRDFAQGDRIVLARIDADATAAGDQAFAFIGDAAFSHTAGELRYHAGVLSGDLDGDGTADLEIGIANLAVLAGTDFLL